MLVQPWVILQGIAQHSSASNICGSDIPISVCLLSGLLILCIQSNSMITKFDLSRSRRSNRIVFFSSAHQSIKPKPIVAIYQDYEALIALWILKSRLSTSSTIDLRVVSMWVRSSSPTLMPSSHMSPQRHAFHCLITYDTPSQTALEPPAHLRG